MLRSRFRGRHRLPKTAAGDTHRRPFSASGGGVLSLFQTDNLPHPVLVAKRELRLHGLGLSLAGMPDGHREAAVYLVVTVIILFGRRGLEVFDHDLHVRENLLDLGGAGPTCAALFGELVTELALESLDHLGFLGRTTSLRDEGRGALLGDRSRAADSRPADGRPLQDPPSLVFLRSEEHTSELQSLMRNSYAVF